MMTNCRRKDAARGRGFTLVELLVVVAIVTVLAAILYPVFSSAREKARASACLSNYRQIALSVHMYANDYDGAIPASGGDFQGLIDSCEPYAKEARIFQCPDDSDMLKEGRPGSYRIPTLYEGKPLDCGWMNPYDGLPTISSGTTLAYEAEHDSNAPIKTTYRHSGGTQFLFFDGHTKWLKNPGTTGDTDGNG